MKCSFIYNMFQNFMKDLMFFLQFNVRKTPRLLIKLLQVSSGKFGPQKVAKCSVIIQFLLQKYRFLFFGLLSYVDLPPLFKEKRLFFFFQSDFDYYLYKESFIACFWIYVLLLASLLRFPL